MLFPIISTLTAGILLILQIALAFTVSGARSRYKTWISDGGHAVLLRLARRHANMAENAGIFIACFTLLELSGRSPVSLKYLCSAFIIVRILHAIGLSQDNTNNLFRVMGGMGTYLLGFFLGGLLLWVGFNPS